MKHNFKILDRNYLKKWGEIDLIASRADKQSWFTPKNKDILHFVEVKTVTRENNQSFSRATPESYEGEDNLHPKKLERLARTIDSYLSENKYKDEQDYQLDAIIVEISRETRKVKIRYIPSIL